MAYIKNIKIKDSVQGAISYIINPEKTMNGQLVRAVGTPPEWAAKMWELTRQQYGKDSGIKAHHFVQSFNPLHKMTIEETVKIGNELAKEQFDKYGFEYVIATHVDTLIFDKDGNSISGEIYKQGMELYNHKGKKVTAGQLKIKEGDKIPGALHNHILVNSVSSTTGKKYEHNNSRDFKKNPNSYVRLRQLNIEVCRRNGIAAVDERKIDDNTKENNATKDNVTLSKYYTSVPYIKTRAYDSWSEQQLNNKNRLKKDIDEAILISRNWEEYVHNMQRKGYEVDWQTKNGSDKKNVTYKFEGMERGRRDRTLNFKNSSGQVVDRYSKEAIIRRIEKNITPRTRIDIRLVNIRRRTFRVNAMYSKGYRHNGNNYMIHPKYRVKHVLGRTIIVKRSIIERMFVLLFMGYPKNVRTDYKKNYRSSVYTKEQLARIKEDLRRTTNRYKLIEENNLKTKEDVKELVTKYRIHLANVNKEIEQQKEKIKANDKVEELLIIKDTYKEQYDLYEEMPEPEKETYYNENKEMIQRYTYAVRELSKMKLENININDCKKTKDILYAEMEEYIKEKNNTEVNLSDLGYVNTALDRIAEKRENGKTSNSIKENNEKDEDM